MNKVLLSICLLSASINSYAQKEENEDRYELQNVVVLSDKLQIPFDKQNRNIQILNAEQIAKIPAKSVNDLLAYIAGVDVRQKGPNGSQADISIDGGGFDQTLVLINGFKASDPQTGHNMMNIPIPIDAIERIEVLKGAAARIYGVNALMGVINIVTKKDKSNNFISRAYVGSSFKKDDSTGNTYANFGIQAMGQMSTDKWQHLIAGSWDQGNGFRYNTTYKNSKVLYTANGQLSQSTKLELMAGLVNNEFGANAFYAAPGDKNATEEVNTSFLSFRAPINISKAWTIRPSLNYRNGYDHYIYIKQKPEISQNKHRTHTIDASLDNIVYTQYGNIAFGLNIRNEKIISTNLGDRSRINYGAFLEYQYSFKETFDLNIGAYLNQNSDYGFKVYPGIDIGYKINSSLRAFANAGMGQRLPTFTDLYYKGPGNQGNDALLPEYMIGYEAGLKFNHKNFNANASVFYKNGRDFIDWIRPDTSHAWMANNFNTINNFGVHFDGSYAHKWNKHTLQLYLGYTYLQPKVGSISDASKASWASQYAVNALQHQVVFRANILLNNNWTIAISNRYLDRLNAGASINGYNKKSYFINDLRFAYQHKNASIYLDINNSLNIKYIESGVVPLPGRWITVGFIYKLN